MSKLRRFLGFVTYYRRFIPSFSDLAEPLVALTGKDVPFIWRPACAAAFTKLRDAMVREPILAFPTESGDCVLDTDASNFGLGGVLSQIQNNVECVIAYCSHALRPSQCKYCTTKREMMAVVSMCIQFRSYLRGSPYVQTISHWHGYIASRIQKAWWPGGSIPYTSSSSPSYTEPEMTMTTLTGGPGPPLTLADSVHMLNAPGWIHQWWSLISHLMMYR